MVREGIGKAGLNRGFQSGGTEPLHRASDAVLATRVGIYHLQLADQTARRLGIATEDDVEAYRHIRPSTRRRVRTE